MNHLELIYTTHLHSYTSWLIIFYNNFLSNTFRRISINSPLYTYFFDMKILIQRSNQRRIMISS